MAINLKSSAGMSPAPRTLSFLDGSSYDPQTGQQLNAPSVNPKAGLPMLTNKGTGGPTTSGAPAAPALDTNHSEDPVTKFNLGLLELLKRAQGYDPAKLMNERNRLAIAQTQNSMGSADSLGLNGLKPSDALQSRKETADLYNPEIKNLTDRVQAGNQAISNFKDSIDAATKYGEQYAKTIKPTDEVIKAAQDMLEAGHDPSSAVLDKVSQYIDWGKVAVADKGRKDNSAGTQTERDAAKKGEAITKITAAFNQRGSDTYINPDLYREMRDNWGKEFGSVASFYKEFPIFKYISPQNQVGDLVGDSNDLIG